MSVISGWRYSSASSGSTHYDTATIQYIGFRVSGLTDANIIGVANFDYNYATDKWVPQAH